MRFKNEHDCVEAIEEWQQYSAESQVRNLNRAIETMELDLMYYRDKGSERTAGKLSKCLELLNKRLSVIESD